MQSIMCIRQLVLSLVLILTYGSAFAASDFALRDGDTVVFLGDSITAAQTYGKIIENYTLLRFPGRKVHFINAGKGGDTAADSLRRLDRDVFQRNATVVTVAFGINDIGWGMKADPEHRQKYLDSIAGIVDACKQHNVRAFICSAPVTGADPYKSETEYLQKMCDDGMKLAKEHGADTIDIQRAMRAIQKRVWDANKETSDPKAKMSLHAEDTIHLNDYGQIAMAFAILKGLGAPALVSSAIVTSGSQPSAQCENCEVTDVECTSDSLTFTRKDDGLPLNLGLVGLLSYRFVPIPDEINRYMLAVRGLAAGKYEIVVDSRKVGTYDAEALTSGVNLGSATPDPWEAGGTWDVQASILRPLTDARSEIEQSRRTGMYYSFDAERMKDLNSDATICSAQIEHAQRRVAAPQPYRFVVRRAAAK